MGSRSAYWCDTARDTATRCSRRVARLDDEQRFERHVDQGGEHHPWTGSTNPLRDTGRLQVDGKQMTAHRRAWEFVYGSHKPGVIVLPWPADPLCERVEHLRLAQSKTARSRSRAPRSSAVSKRVQVQVNGVHAHRRVQGDRTDAEATRVLLREELRDVAATDRDATRCVERHVHCSRTAGGTSTRLTTLRRARRRHQ